MEPDKKSDDPDKRTRIRNTEKDRNNLKSGHIGYPEKSV